jgi:hypothetical protein
MSLGGILLGQRNSTIDADLITQSFINISDRDAGEYASILWR